MTYQLHHGNLLDILPMMERDSIDAIVTDPPYGLGFMGKDWDHGVPGEHFWREVWRVAKPGAHLLAFGGTRTFHRLACAIEDAGWEIRDTVMWIYGQGFPKSHDVSKAIDREAGVEREVIGKTSVVGMFKQDYQIKQGYRPDNGNGGYAGERDGANITSPATPAAVEWDGWGTALKPAWEPILVARKPLQGTVAENVQRYGTGAMNIDGCRIEIDDTTGRAAVPSAFKDRKGGDHTGYFTGIGGEQMEATGTLYNTKGRWPANMIHDGSAEVLAGFPMTNGNGGTPKRGNIFGGDGEAQMWNYGDTGSAARFFYCAKASKQDRDEGCEGFDGVIDGVGALRDGGRQSQPRGNHHPTVKPTALMRYLCRLVTPPAGVILDPFMGSGSTGKAAILEGFNFIGVDTKIEYVEIAARRIEHACEKVGIVVEQPMMFETKRETVDRPKQLILL